MISCPLCGARSNLSVEIPVTETRTWTHYCPVCKKPWRVKVWARRGRTELSVEPDVELALKEMAEKKPAKKTGVKKPTRAKPAAKKKTKKKG